MPNEHLAQLWTNIHNIEHASIRLYESDKLEDSEVILIKNASFLWFGILLEKASAVLSGSSFCQFKGRLLKQSTVILTKKEGFHTFLSLLDEVDDVIISIISSDSSQFKAKTLLKELHCCISQWSPELWRTLSPVMSQLLSCDLTRDTVLFLRQLSNLLSKLHIARPDLLADSIQDFYNSEFLSFAETSVQTLKTREYWDFILAIRAELQDVIDAFDMHDCIPRHGPGAVSNPKVKTKIDKYLDIGYDPRIDYLLRKGSGETMGDYSPFPLTDLDRASRVIFVPKSWKKLRGISAEPTGLQYFQQGVLNGLKKAISKSRLRHVIKLHDQSISGQLALKGSRDGSLVTIDLSSASDSVTLRLVKDIFGNSLLCRWLLATRSTHTLIENQRLEIYKFAPMGSACCFPVECLVFAGIVLATATLVSRGRPLNMRNYQVYGDDIICPTSISDKVMDNLAAMGFIVNTDKSYCSGDYRESCGIDAWRGFDVTPLKLKDFSLDFNGTNPCSYEHQTRVVSYLNYLYNNGYKELRSFLLEKFLKLPITVGRQTFSVQDTLVFGDGTRGTLCSCQPDNFHLKRVPIKGYQRYGYKVIGWKPRYRMLSPIEEFYSLKVLYFEWLLSTRADSYDHTVSYDLAYFQTLDSETSADIRLGMRMIPTFGLHDPWGPVV